MAGGQGYVPGLDGLRAISVTLVLLGHLGFGGLFPGGLGVTVFFFISGYLITGLLMAERQAFGRIDMPRFFGRRALRLLPELVAFLGILTLVLGPLLSQPVPLKALAAGLLYFTNYYVVFGWGMDCVGCGVTGHLWSLAVEEHFYLLVPLAMAGLAFASRRLIVLFVAVIAAAMLWRAFAWYGLHLSEVYTYKTTESRLDSIAWGCLAAVLQKHSPAFMAFMKKHARAMFGLGTAMLLVSLAWRDEGFRATFRYSLQGLALFCAVVPLATSVRLAPLVRLLELAPLRWMGRRSYGAYLWHYVALTFAAMALSVPTAIEEAGLRERILAAPIGLALTWLLAWGSYELVFKPVQRFKPLFAPRPPAGAAAPEPKTSELATSEPRPA